GLGALSSGLYFWWWLTCLQRYGVAMLPFAVVSLVYVVVQLYFAWYVYLSIRKPASTAAPPGLSVDVFVPVYEETLDLVERSLAPAVATRSPHRTYLLDDRRDPRLAALAERLDVGYLTRPNNEDAKAGNINAALARTDGEFVTIFDVDH